MYICIQYVYNMLSKIISISYNKEDNYLKHSCTIAHLHVVSFFVSLSIKETSNAIWFCLGCCIGIVRNEFDAGHIG